MRGFTVIEFVIVLAIVAFLSALAMTPSTIFSDNTNWNQTMITVRDTIQQARNLARSHNQCVTLTVTATSMVVNGYPVANPTPVPNPCVAPLINPTSTYTAAFQSNVTLVPFDLENPLVFVPSGGTDLINANTKMQVLQGKYSRTYSVNPVLGQTIESVP